MEPDGRFRELADEFSQFADAIRAEQPVKFSSILAAIDAARDAWAAICSRAEELGIAGLSADLLDPAGYRTALAAELERQKAELERRRRTARIAEISVLIGVTHATDIDFTPLATLTRHVQEATALIEAGADEQLDLAPFRAVIELIAHWNILPDHTADDLHTAVAEAFGSKLALAAVRGRLRFGQAAAEPAPPVSRPTVASVEPAPAELRQQIPVEAPVAVPDVVITPTAPEPAPPEPTVPEPEPEPEPEPVPVSEPEPEPEPPPPEPPPGIRLDDGNWAALAAGRPGLAWHLLAAEAGPESVAAAGMAALLALAPRADGSFQFDRVIAQRCEGLWSATVDVRFDDPVRLLALLASLRVGLLAPESGVAGFIADSAAATGDAPLLRGLAVNIGDIMRSGGAVTPYLVAGRTGEAELGSALAAVSAAARRWLDRQANDVWPCGRAGGIWRSWLGDDGRIGRMLRIVIENHAHERGVVQEIRTALTTDLAGEIAAIDHALHGKRADRATLGAAGLQTLTATAAQACVLARHWEGIHESFPDRWNPARDGLERLRQVLLGDTAALRDELGRLLAPHDSALRIAIGQLEALIALVAGTVAPGLPFESRLATVAPDRILNLELLLIPELDLEPDLGLGAGPAPDPALIRQAMEQGDWNKAAASRIERRDFPGAEYCLDGLALEGRPDLAHLREYWQAALVKARSEIERRQNDLLRRSAGAALANHATEAEQLDIDAIIRGATAPPFDNFRAIEQHLNEAEALLGQIVQRAREAAERRLDDDALAQVKPATLERIRQLLRNGRVALADLYIDRLLAGRDLPKLDDATPSWGSAFPAFYGTFIDQAHALHRARGSLAAIRDAVAMAPRFLEPLEALGGNEPLRLEAMEILESWEIGKRRADEEAHKGLQRLFTALRFNAAKVYKYVAPSRNATDALVHVQSAIINDRDTVMLPSFGSEALGHYRVVLLWEPLPMQHVLRRVTSSLAPDGGPIIVLAFRAIDRADRQLLAQLIAADRDTPQILVLDELLLLFIAQYQGAGGRLKALFDCTAPFTTIDPFVTEGDPVPAELFVARQPERQAILAPDASGFHFVYGARHAGKTALLRQIEIAAASESKGQAVSVAKCIDIKSVGRNAASPPGAIIRILGDTLKAAGLPVSGADSYAQFARKIGDWLDDPLGGGKRRILLMLDDADAFLRKDGEDEFRELRQLRDLVTATGQRVRIIIAGLQTVRRVALDAKSPVAALRQSTLLGPLRRSTELHDAERLARQPLETLGLCFKDPDTVAMLLTACDYQPSLLQAAAKRVLTETRRKCQDRPELALLYEIQDEDVTALCSKPPLRDDINARLQLTLNIEGRYDYVALLLALLAGGDTRRCLAVGATLEEIRDQALTDWPRGFARGIGPDGFRTLLDEMVDFGMLRLVRPDTYAIRNWNMLQALGELSTIERRYREAIQMTTGAAVMAGERPMEEVLAAG
jgi:hypothetical protein